MCRDQSTISTWLLSISNYPKFLEILAVFSRIEFEYSCQSLSTNEKEIVHKKIVRQALDKWKKIQLHRLRIRMVDCS